MVPQRKPHRFDRPSAKASSGSCADLDDRLLVQALIAGSHGAWEAFVSRTEACLRDLVAAGFGSDGVDEEYQGLLERLKGDGFAALSDFDGRSRLTTFLRLRAGDLLADRILRLFGCDEEAAWRAFEKLYAPELRRLVARGFRLRSSSAGAARMTPEDAYQEVCAALVADRFRRLRSFDGRGSFSAYVRRVVRNLCTDLQRREIGRRRLPERVQRGTPLEAEAYQLVAWRKLDPAAVVSWLGRKWGETHRLEDIRAAVDQVRECAPDEEPARAAGGDGELLPDPAPSPEEQLVRREQAEESEHLRAVLVTALEALPSDEQLYVRLRFFTDPPLGAADIARLMNRPCTEIYRLRERAIGRLKRALVPGAESGVDVRPKSAREP